jgi:hypothetical protein
MGLFYICIGEILYSNPPQKYMFDCLISVSLY